MRSLTGTPRSQTGTLPVGPGNEIRGDIRVALEYRQGKLEVFISHVRDLVSRFSHLLAVGSYGSADTTPSSFSPLASAALLQMSTSSAICDLAIRRT